MEDKWGGQQSCPVLWGQGSAGEVHRGAGVSVCYQGVSVGVGGQGSTGTAPLSPAVQPLVGMWLSLPEHSAPPSLFPSFQPQQLSHSPRLIPGVPWHLCISKPSPLVSVLHPGLPGSSFFPLLTWKKQLLALPHTNSPCSPRSLCPSHPREGCIPSGGPLAGHDPTPEGKSFPCAPQTCPPLPPMMSTQGRANWCVLIKCMSQLQFQCIQAQAPYSKTNAWTGSSASLRALSLH